MAKTAITPEKVSMCERRLRQGVPHDVIATELGLTVVVVAMIATRMDATEKTTPMGGEY